VGSYSRMELRISKELLVEGSGMTGWLGFFLRLAFCDLYLCESILGIILWGRVGMVGCIQRE
jgi:hypothetical protein